MPTNTFGQDISTSGGTPVPTYKDAPNSTPTGSIALPKFDGTTAYATPLSTPTVPSTISSTSLAPTAPVNYQTPNYPSPYPVAGLGAPQVDPYANTDPQNQAQTLDTQLASLNDQLAGKAADTNALYKAQGFSTMTDANGNIVADPGTADLQAKLTSLQNEALAIPVRNDQAAVGRQSQYGDQVQTTADLRNNAVAALGVSSLIAAKNGQLTTAEHYVNAALTQKYGPIEAELKAKTANLQLILNSPDYTNAEKKQAAAQAQAVAQQQAQLDFAKTNYTNTQNEVLKYAGIADAQTLNAMSKAQSPAEVAQIAAQAGIQQPQAGRYQDQTTTIKNLDGSTSIVRKIFDTVTGKFVDTPAGTSASTLNAQSPASHASSSGVTGITGSPTVNATTPGYSSTIVPNSGGLTQAAIDQAAIVFATTGKFPTGIGIGGTGLAGQKKTAIQNRAAELNAGGNMTANAANLKSYSASLATQQKYLDTTQRSVANAEAGYQQVISAFQNKGINNQTLPIANFLTNAAKYQLTPGDLSAFRAGLTEVANEYSQVFSRGGQVSDQVRQRASSIADGNLSLADLGKVFTELQAQGHIVIQGSQTQIQTIQSQINNILSPATPSTSGSVSKGSLSDSTFVQQALTSQGLNYDTVMAHIPTGQKGVILNSTGQVGHIPPNEYDPKIYTSL